MHSWTRPTGKAQRTMMMMSPSGCCCYPVCAVLFACGGGMVTETKEVLIVCGNLCKGREGKICKSQQALEGG